MIVALRLSELFLSMKQKKSAFLRSLTTEALFLAFFVSLGFHAFAPSVAEAFTWPFSSDLREEENTRLPRAGFAKPRRIVQVSASAYSSEPEQTDDTPFITASGAHVRHGIVATNALPLGTQVRFPDLYGDEVFVVEDRMNTRYWDNVDFWMEETADARNFGRRTITMEIY